MSADATQVREALENGDGPITAAMVDRAFLAAWDAIRGEYNRETVAQHLNRYLLLASRPAADVGERHIKRVKVDEVWLQELAKESAPVTFRFEVEPDGDLMLVMTRHDCPATPTASAPQVTAEMVEAVARWGYRHTPRNQLESWEGTEQKVRDAFLDSARKALATAALSPTPETGR